ncbi:hypothetical protein [Sulfuriferula plumbiphila]|nr:hypothetical protein [Sulfuriferula plumbiphila]
MLTLTLVKGQPGVSYFMGLRRVMAAYLAAVGGVMYARLHPAQVG